MLETSASLLERVRDCGDTISWQRFVSLYTPLFHHWIRLAGVDSQDAEEVVQEVFLVIVRKIADFRYQPDQGRFRGWLRILVTNCLKNHGRRKQPTVTGDSDFRLLLEQLEDESSEPSRDWDTAHDWHILLGIFEQLRTELEPTTIEAFQRTVLQGQETATVATELNISLNAVFLAKSRVLKRLRQELAGLD